ncbi:hypothetical protein CANCADRAFT_2907 [Tortispora caseinolytica NRRL Y-17796]|uniref:Geranylgeranyl transferase type-2 subunit beta n=1 Tax=Tortispora caseinolytica NRRL Y-17796 TaxID=767744 RepID=A0A1E4THF3_9ASCO|nr:hypothetical protein CANCADRAFT_2907 [Tortispora caseinolytica NRRL Y-17796]
MELVAEKHVHYVVGLDKHKDDLEYWLTEHLRINGMYWGLVALCMLGSESAVSKEETVDFVLKSYDSNSGGFGAAPRHDPHILSTLSAIQILYIYDALDRVDTDAIADYICSLQDPKTGAVQGDKYGEEDTRFVYNAVSTLRLLGRLFSRDESFRSGDIDNGFSIDLATKYIMSCKNFDGGFSSTPDGESHGAQAFVCIGALKIMGRLNISDFDLTASWLAKRQLPEGGLNGRPEKLPDVCYSWWILSTLAMLGKLHWINKEKLIHFILQAQDTENGGIADRTGNLPDVFHTVFGLTGLSLLGYPGLQSVSPVFCMPTSCGLPDISEQPSFSA